MSIISGMINANAQKKAAKQVANSNKAAAAQEMEMFRANEARLAPFTQIGTKLAPIWMDSLGVNGQEGYDRTVGMYRESPGYQFALDASENAIGRQRNAQGGYYSGATLKALQRNAMGMKDQDYGNWQNALFGGVNLGQAAAAGVANLGAAAANNAGNRTVAAGNALAQGTLGAANAWTNALGQATQLAAFGLGGGFKPGSTLGKWFG